MLRIITLKKRSEFLRLRRVRFFRTPGFVLRIDPTPPCKIEYLLGNGALTKAGSGVPEPFCRVGYTVSKQVSKKAVVRNRVKRRLREIMHSQLGKYGKANHDYVLIAQHDAPDIPFKTLEKDMIRALKRLRQPRKEKSKDPSAQA